MIRFTTRMSARWERGERRPASEAWAGEAGREGQGDT